MDVLNGPGRDATPLLDIEPFYVDANQVL
jgi:hypothetical protein